MVIQQCDHDLKVVQILDSSCPQRIFSISNRTSTHWQESQKDTDSEFCYPVFASSTYSKINSSIHPHTKERRREVLGDPTD
jgi:hypothetical protein